MMLLLTFCTGFSTQYIHWYVLPLQRSLIVFQISSVIRGQLMILLLLRWRVKPLTATSYYSYQITIHPINSDWLLDADCQRLQTYSSWRNIMCFSQPNIFHVTWILCSDGNLQAFRTSWRCRKWWEIVLSEIHSLDVFNCFSSVRAEHLISSHHPSQIGFVPQTRAIQP